MQMNDRTGPSKTVLRLARDLIRISATDWTPAQAEQFLDQLDQSIRRYLLLDLLTGTGDRLTTTGSQTRNKIQAIKLIRAYTGWGLKEAKEFVELAGGEISEMYLREGERKTSADLPETLSSEQLTNLNRELAGTGYQLE